jgi:MFS family permease
MAGAPGPHHLIPETPETTGPSTEYPHTRWNFAVIVADASAFITGLAFASPLVVLPLFIERLTGSTVLVGVITALQMAGWFLPQLATASYVEHQPRKKPFMLKACILGRMPVALIPISLIALAGHPQLVLAIFLAVYFFFYLSDGMTGVPWTDIGAKTIPPRLRGRFFGAMQFVGGALSVLAGLAVRKILGNPRLPYPHDYATLFAIQFVLLMVSLVFLALIREPMRPVREDRRGFVALLRAAPGLLRANAQFVRMLVVAGLAWGGTVAVPFYAVYAHDELGLPDAMAGVFVSAQMAGGIVSSMVWAYVSDRVGSRRVIQGTALCSLAAPLFGLLAPFPLSHHGPQVLGYGYAFTFFLLGAVANGGWIGYTNFTLEVVEEKERPSYIGLMYSVSAPAVLVPVLGGWLVKAVGYQPTFARAARFGALSIIATLWLREPREARPVSS